jgi:hypothetical protein
MTTLYSFGADPTRWYSRSKWNSTTDGTTFTTGAEPVTGLGSITTAAKNGTWWCAATNYGQFTVSSDLINWYSYDIENKLWLTTKINSGGGLFAAVGHEKNTSNGAETGFIATSPSGAPATWTRRYVSYTTPMCLFDVRYIGGNQWIAVGSSESLTTPVLLYSNDNALTWQTSSLPSIINSAIYSVECSTTGPLSVWIGGKGWVAKSTNWAPNTSNWTLNNTIRDGAVARPVTKLFYRGTPGLETLVALTGSTAWFTGDDVIWQSAARPGYRFLDAVDFVDPATGINTLYLSAEGLMQQYTGFKTRWAPSSTQSLSLTGYNNGVQAHSLIAV